MLMFKPAKVYISSANADMRKGIDGFASIVEQKFQLDPFSDAMFVSVKPPTPPKSNPAEGTTSAGLLFGGVGGLTDTFFGVWVV